MTLHLVRTPDTRCWNCRRLPADHNRHDDGLRCVSAPYPGATSWPRYEPRGDRKWPS